MTDQGKTNLVSPTSPATEPTSVAIAPRLDADKLDAPFTQAQSMKRAARARRAKHVEPRLWEPAIQSSAAARVASTANRLGEVQLGSPGKSADPLES